MMGSQGEMEEVAMDYSDQIRQGEYRRKGARFSERELREMREQARALLHLAATGWLPAGDKQATLDLNDGMFE